MALEELIALLSASDAEVRLKAAYRIGASGAVSTVPLLIRTLDDGRPEARHAALIALRTLYSQANARHDAHLRVALEAAEVIDAMARCLRDGSHEAVIAASMALQFVGCPAARAALDSWRQECGIPQNRQKPPGSAA